MKITAVIPIRSGSQSVKDKNLREFGDTCLMALNLKNLLQVPEIDQVIVNTSSDAAIEMTQQLASKYVMGGVKRTA